MKLKRWQLVWTLLVGLWVTALASPMLVLKFRGDTEQLIVYFGMWIAVGLIPSAVVYPVGLLFGTLVSRASISSRRPGPGTWRTAWLLASIAWIFLVAGFCVVSDGPFNPFYRFAWPLAAATALVIALVPPALVHIAGSVVSRFRAKAEDV